MLGAAATEDDGDAGSAGRLLGVAVRAGQVAHRGRPYRRRLRTGILAAMPLEPDAPLSPATVAVSAGRPPRQPDGPMNPPLVMASTYHAGGEVGYGRYGNPTWEMFESAVGALEGGVATSFASGMAAVAAALDLVPQGGVVVTGAGRLLRQPAGAAAAGAAGPADGPAGRPHRRRRDGGRRAGRRPGVGRVADQPDAQGGRPRGAGGAVGRGRRAAGGRQHLRDADPAAAAGDRRRRRRAQRDEVPVRATPTCCSASRSRTTSTWPAGWSSSAARWAPSRAPSRPGWRCAGCAPCTCGSSAPRPTPPSWHDRLAAAPGGHDGATTRGWARW